MERLETDIKFLTVEEAALILKTSIRTLYRMVLDHQIPGFFKVGGQWRIRESGLQEWIGQTASKTDGG